MINYRRGDASLPEERPAMVCHICNDIGKWGSGFVLSLRRNWGRSEEAYRKWYKHWCENPTEGQPFELGEVQFVRVDSIGGDPHMWKDEVVYVANMIAQHNVIPFESVPIRLPALDKCLARVGEISPTLHPDITLHMPRIGCGLARARWIDVEPLIEKNLSHLEVYVYDYP